MSALPSPTPKRFTKEEFYRLGELGFASERSELISGEIIEMPPIGPEHADITTTLAALLIRRLPDDFVVRAENPLDLGSSQPQPDIAVVRGARTMFRHAHPKTAELVVEVSQSSLEYDLEVKARLYAGAGIREYVVLDADTKRAIVHRSPTAEGYGEREEVREGHLAFATLPGISIRLDELF